MAIRSLALLMFYLFSSIMAKTIKSKETSSSCPDTSVYLPCSKCSAGEEVDRYFYLEDGTKCPSCPACVIGPFLHEGCPMLPCRYVHTQKCENKEFKRVNLYLEYKGKECRACETFICE